MSPEDAERYARAILAPYIDDDGGYIDISASAAEDLVRDVAKAIHDFARV